MLCELSRPFLSRSVRIAVADGLASVCRPTPSPPLCLRQALCFDCEEDMIEALAKDTEQFRGKVVIIR